MEVRVFSHNNSSRLFKMFPTTMAWPQLFLFYAQGRKWEYTAVCPASLRAKDRWRSKSHKPPIFSSATRIFQYENPNEFRAIISAGVRDQSLDISITLE